MSDNVLTRTWFRAVGYLGGSGLIIWFAGGPVWPLILACIALFFCLVGFNALSKADDEREKELRRRGRNG